MLEKYWFYIKEEFLSYFGRHAPGDAFLVARKPIFFGVFFIWFFFGMFALWASTVSIESAAIARGTIVVESNRKAIQHLEGGIIKEILVKEGDEVKQGQPLIVLDETAANSNVKQLNQRLLALELTKAKLQAEAEGKNTIAVNDTIRKLAGDNDALNTLLAQTNNELVVHLQAFEDEVNILEKRITQLQNERKGSVAQANATSKQIKLLKEEKAAKDELAKQGYISQSDIRRIEQRIAGLEGDYGEYTAKAASAMQRIDETKLEIRKAKSNHLEERSNELNDAEVEIANLKEKTIASQDVLDRHIIKAPQRGVVTNLKYHTIGGVVAPGAVLMEIVPEKDKLVIDAKVQPNDIDIVHANLPARVKLLAFKTKTTPILKGEVVNVSPDQLIDDKTGAPYFLAKVEIEDTEELKENHLKLYPGMQAEVLIVTGSRTFFEYILQPLKDSMRRAFREQ